MTERSKTFIARRKPVEMKAIPVTEEQVIDTWEGPRTAHPGDYVMIGVKGERWPVQGEKFDDLYEILEKIEDAEEEGMLRVRKCAMEVPVYQTYRPLTYTVRNEKFQADTGYFIVSYGEEDRFPCEPSVFFETFEVLREATEGEDFDVG